MGHIGRREIFHLKKSFKIVFDHTHADGSSFSPFFHCPNGRSRISQASSMPAGASAESCRAICQFLSRVAAWPIRAFAGVVGRLATRALLPEVRSVPRQTINKNQILAI